jgi:hypothetical protein
MSMKILFLSSVITLLLPVALRADDPDPTAPPPPYPGVWPSAPPAGCPFAPSQELTGLFFTGQHVEYENADTWYPSWAADGKLYSSWTDGAVNNMGCGSGDEGWGHNNATGNATILGDDPMHLQIVDNATYVSPSAPYYGRYPAGSLMHGGVWYYGTYCCGLYAWTQNNALTYNWPWEGPFVGFRWSTDYGKTWTQTPHTPDRPLFGESGAGGHPVKIGSPHFVDFGKESQYSPDGKAYLVAHGASDGANRRFGFDSWITGDEIYLLRVTPSIATINDASKYEFYAGTDASGAPVWTRDFAKIKPMLSWRDNMGCVTMTYDAPLKKYLLCVTNGRQTTMKYDSYVLEANEMTGPWKLVTYMRDFGEEGYFLNFPSKFISADGKTLWLCYAANFASGKNHMNLASIPSGSRYGMCLQEVQLKGP